MQGKLEKIDETLRQIKAELSEYGAKKRDIKAIAIFAEELLLLYGSKLSKDTEISYCVVRSTREFYVEFEIPGEEISPKDLQNEQSVFILNNIAKKMEYAVTYSNHQGKNLIHIRIEKYYPLKEYLKLTFGYLGSGKKCLIGGFFFHILSIACNILIPYLTGVMIINYTNDVIVQVVGTAIAIMAARTVYAVFFKLAGDLYNECAYTTRENMTVDLITNMFRVSDSVFESMGSGPFNKRILNDSETISQALTGFCDKVSEAANYIGILAITFVINPVVCIWELAVFLILYYLERRRTNLLYLNLKKSSEADEARFGMISDAIDGAREVKMLGENKLVTERVRQAQAQANQKERIALRKDSSRRVLNSVVTAILYSFIMIYLGYAVHTGILLVTECLILYNYFTGIGLPAVRLIQNMMTQVKQFSLSCERIVDLCTGSAFPKDSYGEKHADRLIGEIKFEDVSFSYQHDDPLEEDRPILEKLNFTIPPVSTTAFVGKSGCGKSTTFKLIIGSHHASSGTVLLDGTDIREYDEETIRNNITMVSQKPYFFNTTVLDNLRMVKPDATMEEIKEVCRKACILEDIERNPDGFNMELGEKGTRVSGGQLQRLAIARALLKGSKIILFDEATSAIDNVTQEKIISVLDDLKKDHTILMVAHRLTTIRNAEKIFLLKDHMIEAEGTHDELMKTSEEYRSLYQKEA